MLKHLPGLVFVSFLLNSSSPAAGSQIRLAGSGSTRCSGRVEIYHNNTWGTICDDGWDLNDAMVVCRELDCGTALSAHQSAHFGEGTGQIWLNDVACSGSEGSLNECQHSGFGTNDCGHGEDAGVVCSVKIPKPTISMNPIGEVNWGQDVRITCLISTQYLGGKFILKQISGPAREIQRSSSNSFSIHQVNFKNEGLYQCHYQTVVSSRDLSSPLSDSVRLSVTVPLQQPNISLTSPDGGLVWSPEAAQVTWGYSFIITCFISSHYPGGVFSLIFSGSKTTVTKPAVNHSASFEFPAAEFEHQGSYSCVYEVTLSSRRFRSTETTTISVVIKLNLSLLVSSVAGSLVLLLLLVLVVICLVHKRRQKSEPGVSSVNELAVRNVCVNSGDEEEEEEQHCMKFEPVQSKRRQMKQTSEIARKDSDEGHDKDKEESGEDAVYENKDLYFVENQEIYVSVETHSMKEVCDDGVVDDNSCVPAHRPFAEDDLDIYGGHEKEESDEDADYENSEGLYFVENHDMYVSVETHSMKEVCDDGVVDDNSCVSAHRPFAEDDLDIYGGHEKEESDEDADYENSEGLYFVENQEIYVSVETHSMKEVCGDGVVDDNSCVPAHQPFTEDDLDIYGGQEDIYENI